MLLPDRIVLPLDVTVIAPAVAVPPLAMIELTVIVPAPASVSVLLCALPLVVRLTPELKSKEPPATLDHCPLPLAFCTSMLNV